MPRKGNKSVKSPLQFLERPSNGARLQNVPEVRASVNPKDFFRENHAQNSSALSSWVSPQFDSSALTALPTARRGRRRCQPAASVLDGCSQLPRKNTVCKFPPLSFQTRSRDQSHQAKSTRAKKAIQQAVVPDVRTKPLGLCPNKKTASSAKYSETPKRQLASIRKKTTETFSDASLSRPSDQPDMLSIQGTKSCRIPADSASTPPRNDLATSDISGVDPPPDVDTPKAIEEGSGCQLSPSVHLLLNPLHTPPWNEPPDILVADTPEGDYGVKVTWRRRKGLMGLLKKRGHLSESDTLIQ